MEYGNIAVVLVCIMVGSILIVNYRNERKLKATQESKSDSQ